MAIQAKEKKTKKNMWKTGSIMSGARTITERSFKIITEAVRKVSNVALTLEKKSKKNNVGGVDGGVRSR